MYLSNQDIDQPFLSAGAKILVTGGTGFIGAYIIKNLVEKGYHVRAIRRSNKIPFFIPEHIWQKVEWIKSDVLDVVGLEEAMQNVQAVIHSAAIVSFRRADRKQMYNINIEGTKNVVNAAIEAGVDRFIHISSVAALGRTKELDKVNEEKIWEESKTNTHYAITKHHAELEVWRGFAEGLSGVIVNPSTVLGYGNWHQSSCAIFKNVYKEFPWFTEGINGFVGVEDVAEAVVQLLSISTTEKRFILNANNWSFQHLFNEIADGFGKRKPYRKATPFLGEIAWRIERIKEIFADGKALLTKESAQVAHTKTEFDNTALLNALEDFNFTTLETVIKEACNKYKEALNSRVLSVKQKG